jgi:hypothetical protein
VNVVLLSVTAVTEASGEKSWFVFNTWANQFEAMPGR